MDDSRLKTVPPSDDFWVSSAEDGMLQLQNTRCSIGLWAIFGSVAHRSKVEAPVAELEVLYSTDGAAAHFRFYKCRRGEGQHQWIYGIGHRSAAVGGSHRQGKGKRRRIGHKLREDEVGPEARLTAWRWRRWWRASKPRHRAA